MALRRPSNKIHLSIHHHSKPVVLGLILFVIFLFVRSGFAEEYKPVELISMDVESMIETGLEYEDWKTSPPERVYWDGFDEVWRVNELIYTTNTEPTIDDLEFLKQQGISSIISTHHRFPPFFEALKFNMSYNHVPSTPHEYSIESLLKMFNIIIKRDGAYLFHGGDGETSIYPYAAVTAKWNDSAFLDNPWRATYLLYEMEYPLNFESGWKFVRSDVSGLQNEKVKNFPQDLSSLEKKNSLPFVMNDLEIAFDNLNHAQSSDWREVQHIEPSTLSTEAQKISEIADRWVSISDMEVLDSGFEELSITAKKLADSIREKEEIKLDIYWNDVKNSCQTCHQATRDNPDFNYSEIMLKYIP